MDYRHITRLAFFAIISTSALAQTCPCPAAGGGNEIQYNDGTGHLAGDFNLTWRPLVGPNVTKSLFAYGDYHFTSDIGVDTLLTSYLLYTNDATPGTNLSGPYATHFKTQVGGGGWTYDTVAVWGEGVYTGSGVISQVLGTDSVTAHYGTGHVLNQTNYQAEFVHPAGTGLLDNLEGFYAWTPPPNVGKFMAFEASPMTNFGPFPANYWAFYSDQLPSYFAGPVTIGATPAYQGAVQQSGKITFIGNSSGAGGIGVNDDAGTPSEILLPTGNPLEGQTLLAHAPSSGKTKTFWGASSVPGGGVPNKVVCWKADGKTLGSCSTRPSYNGACVCN